MPVPMFPVSSSNIAFIGYDDETQELYIRFHNDNVYKYSDVPELVFNELRNNTSVGKYYLNNIKGKYESNKIN